ncbi:nucleotidyltransferase domain-containing protein [Bacteroides uniformis]|uniref:nucleotidyltransferase domain-containing protein n=1 Tax=Bacteroides uniformis TaxID=820 RepID=UPI00203007ED|nr:nucleotidyltransferase domain-containing protein [Bacteroides uniformis]MCM1729259.1 nucleotidyltransferase domain-containing protein [Bacteroides uniformis]MCM1927815.1 nucleotidyltransferase domain-containing protein [Bacteroides uniformis]MCM1932896.1 nucleotidyltransferase domain-containing protein [Bacteroides uniformis]
MYGLTDNELEKLCNLFRKHEEIEQAVLYGSRAKGNFKPFSDIDITLMGDRLTYNTLSSLSDEIDDLLLPYSVDLSILAN